MLRNLLLSAFSLLVLGATSSLFAYTAPAYPDKNGDIVQNEVSDDGQTRIETRWAKGGALVRRTTYHWDGCKWVQKEFHFWKKVNGQWEKDGKLDGSGDVPNDGKAPAPGTGSGAAYGMSSGPGVAPPSSPLPAANSVGTAMKMPAAVRTPMPAPRPLVAVRPY
jgi:hypothetical protein